MKKCTVIIIFLFVSLIGFSQSKKELQEQVTLLASEKQKLIEEKQKLMEDILSLKEQILDLKTENLNFKSENDQLRTSISTNNNTPANLINQSATKPNTATSEGPRERCIAITAKGTQCTRLADPGSKYCWQHKATYEPRSTTTTNNNKSSISSGASSGTTSSGRTIYTGPRGGKYYINSNGNKTYIKK